MPTEMLQLQPAQAAQPARVVQAAQARRQTRSAAQELPAALQRVLPDTVIPAAWSGIWLQVL